MRLSGLSSVLAEMQPATTPTPSPPPTTEAIPRASVMPAHPPSPANSYDSHDSHDLSKNRFGALLDDDDDDDNDGGRGTSGGGSSTKSSQAASSISLLASQHSAASFFKQPSFSGSSATYAVTLSRVNKPQLLETSLGDMSELTGALDVERDVSETERQGNETRSWDLSSLHAATTNLVPEEHRFNDFLGRTQSEYNQDLDTLNQGLLSKRQGKLLGKKKKREMSASRSANQRKSNKMSKGQAFADRMAHRTAGGRRKGGKGGNVGKGSGYGNGGSTGGGGRKKKNRGKGRRQNPY